MNITLSPIKLPMSFTPKTAGSTPIFKNRWIIFFFIAIAGVAGFYFFRAYGSRNFFNRNSGGLPANGRDTVNRDSARINAALTVLDTVKYDQLLLALNNGDSSGRWPVKLKYPLPGAISLLTGWLPSMVISIPKEWVFWENIPQTKCSPNFRPK